VIAITGFQHCTIPCCAISSDTPIPRTDLRSILTSFVTLNAEYFVLVTIIMCYKETTRSLLFLLSMTHSGVLQSSDCSSDDCSTKKEFLIGSNVSLEVDGNTWKGCRFISQDVNRTYSCCYSTLARGDSLCDPERQGEQCRKDVRVQEREHSCVIFLFNVQQSDAGYYQVIFPGALTDNTLVEVTVNERNIVTETTSLVTKETDLSSTAEIEDVKADTTVAAGTSLTTVLLIIIVGLLIIISIFIVHNVRKPKKRMKEATVEQQVEKEDSNIDGTEQVMIEMIESSSSDRERMEDTGWNRAGPSVRAGEVQDMNTERESQVVKIWNYWRDCLGVINRKTKTGRSEECQEGKRQEIETLLNKIEDMDKKLERMDGMLSQLVAGQTRIPPHSSSEEIATERLEDVTVADVEPVLHL